MNDPILIKRATVSDIPMLWNICRLSYSENFAHHWNEGGLEWYLDKVYNREKMVSALANPDIYYFIGFVNGQPAGFMKVNTDSDLPNYDLLNGMEIEKIYFRPQFQGMGLGKKLMLTALSQ